MSSQQEDKDQIARYLLGQLPDEAATAVEERYFTDPAYREVVELVEDELADAYVRRELSDSDSRQFEQHFLSSPARRRKLELAQALFHSASRKRRFHPAYRWAAAILIGAAALSLWMLQRDGSVPPALILTPGDRGLEQPKALVIPEGAPSIAVRAEVESVRTGQLLRSVLRTVDEMEVLRIPVTGVRYSNAGASVDITLPGSLRAGDYILQIEAVGPGAVSRVVGSYFLRVLRRRA